MRGGARANTGFKAAPPILIDAPAVESPVDLLRAVMKANEVPVELRVRAALAVDRIESGRKGGKAAGVRDGKRDAAKKAGEGKFASPAGPRLVA